MAQARVLIDGDTLELEEILQIARGEAQAELAPEAAARVKASRALVEKVAAGETPSYGINTGFGTLAEVRIDKKDLRELQRNLILSHAAGVGTPLPLAEARALLLLRCNVLAKGFSGIRSETLQLALDMLNRGVIPVVPERGSVGASGDLAPLAHLALVLIGEGEAFFEGQRLPAKEALAKAGLKPTVLEAKEGLALVNGTQAMCAVGTVTLLRAEMLAELADVAGAMTLEGLLGSHKPFIPEIHDVRPHVGQKDCAAHLRRLLAGSELVETHANCSKVQDPYSLRCMPQVHGSAREAFGFARRILKVEVNSATDNPLVFVDKEQIVSGGNFHGQPISLALDVVAMGLTQLSSISERRVEQLVNPCALRAAAVPREELGAELGLHDRPGHLGRARRRVARALAPRVGRLDPLLRRPRGPRLDGHDRRAQGPADRRVHPLVPRDRDALRGPGARPARSGEGRQGPARGLRAHPLEGPAHGEGPRDPQGHRGGLGADRLGRAVRGGEAGDGVAVVRAAQPGCDAPALWGDGAGRGGRLRATLRSGTSRSLPPGPPARAYGRHQPR